MTSGPPTSLGADVGAFIVDDEDDVRLALRLAIEIHNQGLYVAGEAGTGSEAIELLASTDANVVVLDQMMPGMDGLATAAQLLALRPGRPIVLFSAYLDDELREAALRSGIRVCVRKDKMRELPALLLELGHQT